MESVEPGRLEDNLDAAPGRWSQVAEDVFSDNVPQFRGQSEPYHFLKSHMVYLMVAKGRNGREKRPLHTNASEGHLANEPSPE